MTTDFSSKEYLDKVDAYWRAANYISVGQLYLLDNPLLKEPIKPEHVKIKVVGHWGTIAGQNFIYAHLNRIINKYDLNMFYIEGPGHGGQVMVSNAYLDGSYSEIYPNVSQDIPGLKRLYKQFSFPGGISSHAAPETPGSIHEGGELGYSLMHGAGAVLDNPDLIAAVVVGDGESETGPLATSWELNKFLNPIHDGAVLPIFHLNGFKIANPTLLSRIPNEQLTKYFEGLGWEPIFVEGHDPEKMHPAMAAALDQAVEKIQAIQENARSKQDATLPIWPMIVFRSPKGWTGPKIWDGDPIEGSFRAHQVPIPIDREHMEHADHLVSWMKSYRPEELFTDDGQLVDDIKAILPPKGRRMAQNPVTNGGKVLTPLRLPEINEYEVDTHVRGGVEAQDMTVMGEYIKDVLTLNEANHNFRIFGPDETLSNRLNPVFEETRKQWLEKIEEPQDQYLAPSGRVIDSILSEHMDEGLLEGYVLTGRHGFFASYEAFLRVVDSMITQHQKWLKVTNELPWREKLSSLNLIASSIVWQQDHNGFTHQDPGILGHLADKHPDVISEYLASDANTLLVIMEKMLKTRHKVNLVVTSKQPTPQWFSLQEARTFVEKGAGLVDWASTGAGEPDVVIAVAGPIQVLEGLAAVQLLHERLPELKIRFVNVVDILKLRTPEEYPGGMTDAEFDALFTTDKPVIFAFHGYKGLLQNLIYRRRNRNVTIHGYEENGAITTPFDMRVMNHLDRFHLVKSAVLSLPQASQYAAIIQEMDEKLAEHEEYTRRVGTDLPEVADWHWQPLQ
ncbi:phosphoketolase [Enterococcus canis]|uniref:Probable phosphoketolase n=1 Tax=Enterococcus canis TaxID=214095 RepID=A0A1L8RCK9_9ENTE|nr:phosphoketolase family protein [Enterococcus canis]OJG17486.1 phosphoketolase [Enterococcus canis]